MTHKYRRLTFPGLLLVAFCAGVLNAWSAAPDEPAVNSTYQCPVVTESGMECYSGYFETDIHSFDLRFVVYFVDVESLPEDMFDSRQLEYWDRVYLSEDEAEPVLRVEDVGFGEHVGVVLPEGTYLACANRHGQVVGGEKTGFRVW